LRADELSGRQVQVIAGAACGRSRLLIMRG
jgi:hypothetical protein